MAIAQIAMAAGTAAVKYGPGAIKAARVALQKVSGGKLADVTKEQIAKYVGTSEPRMTVVADALVRAGVKVDEIFPTDIVGTNARLMAMRDAAQRLAGSLAAVHAATADKTLEVQGPGIDADAAAAMRVLRARTALEVYGTAERYALLNPTGGIPFGDFAFAKSMASATTKRV